MLTLWRTIFWTGGLALLYLATAELGLKYAVIGETVTLLWPPSGIALTAMLIGGYRACFGIALGAFMANVLTDVPLITVLFITVGNTLEPLMATVWLKRRKSFALTLDRVSDVIALLVYAALISTMIGASLGATGLLAGGKITAAELGATWLAWWMGDGLGVLVVSPLLLTGYGMMTGAIRRPALAQGWEALMLTSALLLIGQAVFGAPILAARDTFPFSLAMFPFAIWGGLRFGSIGSASVAMLVSLLAIHGTVQGTGPFAVDSVMGSLMRWCLFADLMAITGLLLAAVSAEREKAQTALKATNDNLEKLVRQRTEELTGANLELQRALAERRSLQWEMNQLSEKRQEMVGQELHDGLGQQLTGIAFLVSSLYETLKIKQAPELPFIRQIMELLDQALAMVRALARGLYPVALENQSLLEALQHLANYTQQSSGIDCMVRGACSASLADKTTALNLYRIAQEAVANALRHSQADCIAITWSEEGLRYRLAVEDNGIGFPTQESQAGVTLGLRSMRCRADLIGAEFTVCDRPGGGATVVVTGPVNHQK